VERVRVKVDFAEVPVSDLDAPSVKIDVVSGT